MSFLDSLEVRRKRDTERALAQAAAPFADQLRNDPFTVGLLDEAIRIGHSQRTKVHIAWLGANLRLEAKKRKLELRPTAEGVIAVWIEDGVELRQYPIDLGGNGSELARDWLESPAAQT